MENIKITGTIYYDPRKYMEKFSFIHIDFDNPFFDSRLDMIKIAPYTIEIVLDGDINQMIYNKTLETLQKQRKLILAENQLRLNEIDQRIQEHLAIEA